MSTPAPLALSVRRESWQLHTPFVISRGRLTEQVLVVAELRSGEVLGRGEAAPSPRFREDPGDVVQQIEACGAILSTEGGRSALNKSLPAGAARCALDCAFWDLEAKLSGTPVWALAGLSKPRPVQTAFTLSLDEPEAMAAAAAAHPHMPILKLKLGAEGDLERIRAVRRAAPTRRLIVDANEGWSFDDLTRIVPSLADLGVEMVEQPLPSGADEALSSFESPVPLCADEACLDRLSLPSIIGRYQAINIKLEKCGGLTEALVLRRAARELGLEVMVGCRVATSLNMAPAFLLAQDALFADLDGPLMLGADRDSGVRFEDGWVSGCGPALWG